MSRIHTSSIITAALAAVAGTSGADVAPAIGEHKPTREVEVPLDITEAFGECHQFMVVPADSTSDLLTWDQRLSFAACRERPIVAAVTTPQQLGPMVATLEHAVAPSQAIYRDAIARAPDPIKLVATYELGMSYVNIMVRARDAIQDAAGFGGSTYGGGYNAFRVLHLALEPLLASDREAARDAFQRVIVLAAVDPFAAAANAVTEYDVAHARTTLDQLE